MVNHLAIIMDGNRRWAKKKSLTMDIAYKRGMQSALDTVDFCLENKIKYLSLFALSSDNLKRPKIELEILFSLFLNAIKFHFQMIEEKNIQINFIGKKNRIKSDLLSEMENAEKKTKRNTQLKLNIAIDYNGRSEILNSCKKTVEKCNIKKLLFTEEIFLSNLYFEKDLPDVDLLIRTGGEKRISNFMLWHIAYAEIFFIDEMWPDFDKARLTKVIDAFKNRERRFGF